MKIGLIAINTTFVWQLVNTIFFGLLIYLFYKLIKKGIIFLKTLQSKMDRLEIIERRIEQVEDCIKKNKCFTNKKDT